MSASGAERGLGVGVVGLGFMGSTHLAAYRAAAEAGFANRLVAVCDADPDRRAGKVGVAGNIATGAQERLFDPELVRGYADPDELFADSDIELVSICTPTDSHVDLAIRALAAGKHVLVEKPVAVRAIDIERLVSAAEGASTACMPAQCIRFWPAWAHARDAIRTEALGRIRSAVFRRLATPPAWSRAFYTDSERTGGALVDLHIHDTDFVLATFGVPQAVSSTGDLDHLTTAYHYSDDGLLAGPAHIVAEGGWDHTPGFDFRMTFTIVGERATLDYHLGRDPEYLRFEDGQALPIEVAPTSGYDEEVRHLLTAIAAGDPPAVSPRDAWLTARVLEAERESARTRRPVAID